MYTECPLCHFNEMNLTFQGSVTLLTKKHQQKRRIEKRDKCSTVGRNESWCIYSVSNETEWRQMKTNTEFTWELLSKRQLLWFCGDVSLIWPIFQECQFSNTLNASKYIISQSLTKYFLQVNQPARNKSFLHQRPYTAANKHKFFDIDRKD